MTKIPSTALRPARSTPTLIGLVSALAVGLAGGFLGRPYVSPEIAKSGSTQAGKDAEPSKVISALGRLRPKAGVVPVYGPPGDRIAKIYPGVAVGSPVTVKAPLLDLASKDERTTEVAVAQIQLEEAKVSLDKATAAANAKIAAAELESANLAADEGDDVRALTIQIDVLAKHAKYATDQVKRIAELKAQRVSVSQDEQDQADLLAAKADAEWQAATIKRTKAVDGYRRGKELAMKKLAAAKAERDEAIARAPIRSSEKKLELARQLLDLTTIRSPVAGTVLSLTSQVGEPTGPHQAIMHLAETSSLVVVAEVYESDLKSIWSELGRKVGAKTGSFTAKIEAPALDGALVGTVDRADQVGRMIARNAVFALSPREDADRRVVEVTVDIDAKSGPFEAARNLVGLQVRVTLTPAAGN